jgi:hypothetical protein
LLVEKKQINGLNPMEELRMRIHLTGCSICKLYQSQSILIGKVAGKMDQEFADTASLDNESKKKLELLISTHRKK